MTDTPNPADFSKNEREREYMARINVRGTISLNLKADNPEEAYRKAVAEMERIEKEGFIELDELDEIEIGSVFKNRPMFRVIRNGKPMQVSHLDPGDLPRQPDERGF